MDNPLTPKKIQKLINLAEGRSSIVERLLLTEEDVNLMVSHANAINSPGRYESSSGILDLDHVEGFGESAMLANMSLSKSSAFNPGELTGRSTGAESIAPKSALGVPKQQYGRHSIDLDSIISEMDKQTSEVNEIMRHSIATNTHYSFHSKRDLTADEASLIAREAPLPVMQTTQTYFQDSTIGNTSNVSVGAYFKNRCVDFGKILAKTDSPDRSMMPSITEVSASANFEFKESNVLKMDDMLDSVPVRQPRNTDIQNQMTSVKPIPLFKEPMKPKPLEMSKLESVNFPDRPLQMVSLNPAAFAHKSFMTSSKPADVLLKKLHTSFKVATEDAEGSMENSLSISKIADYLGNQSNVSVTDMMQLNQKRPALNKQPLTELHMNTQTPEIHVTKLIDTKKTETASSAGTIDTVISIDKLKIQDNVPKVIITQDIKLSEEDKHTRPKSPSTKSPSTLSTVRENYASFKSEDSPNSSNGEANRSKVPSPNIAYKELDKSVDWQEVLQQKRKRQRAGAKEHWVEISLQPVQGYVGVATLVAMSVTTLTDSWLTTKFQFDDVTSLQKDLNLELPRLPLLLSPGKSEQFTFYITSNVELDTVLPFTFYVKDGCLEGEVQQKGELRVKFKNPVIQAMSSDGLNKLVFPAAAEKTSLTKTLVLISDCPADLQIKLLITEGDSIFSIRNVQEIRKSEVNKAVLEREGFEDKVTKGKVRMSKQLCRLGSNSAIRVAITFDAPKLADLKIVNSTASFSGALQVALIGSDTILRRVDMIGVVGVPELVIDAHDSKIKVSKEPTELTVSNTGRVRGSWSLMVQNPQTFPFKLPSQLELAPGETQKLQIAYIGLEDGVVEIPIRYEEVSTGKGTDIVLIGGTERVDKLRNFPIKTNQTSLSWVRAGRKEVSLKNITDKKVHVRCTIVGEGFSIELPGGDSRGVFILSFNGCECRPLPIVFTPSSSMPQTASLHLMYDRHSEFSKKIPLYGCGAGEPLRWAGLVTFSATAALVRAAPRLPVDLTLHNKSSMPAFVAASVHFNLQYASVEAYSTLLGSHKIVCGRGAHSVSLRLDWARVERAARDAATTALATVTVLTGAEATRRRILKIIKNESKGQLDVSLLPDHLKVLAKEFDGEDSSMDDIFKNFNEPKTCLNELMSGLRELTAHIDLPQDYAEDHTILISDDTVVEHHTLCD